MTREAADQELTNPGSLQSFWASATKKARVAKLVPVRELRSRAGDGIRAGDVQLGKPNQPYSEKPGKP